MESVTREVMNSEVFTPKKKSGITGSTLKWIAIVTMLIDHIAATVLARMIIDRGYYEIMIGDDMDGMVSVSQENSVLILVMTLM